MVASAYLQDKVRVYELRSGPQYRNSGSLLGAAAAYDIFTEAEIDNKIATSKAYIALYS